jgi:hypothetical protein
VGTPGSGNIFRFKAEAAPRRAKRALFVSGDEEEQLFAGISTERGARPRKIPRTPYKVRRVYQTRFCCFLDWTCFLIWVPWVESLATLGMCKVWSFFNYLVSSLCSKLIMHYRIGFSRVRCQFKGWCLKSGNFLMFLL